ncbi:MAG: TonB-dependent receptor plug domain-containing protein, partial [Phycisphaeraceae bacterium]|nr:TonB-dependent receptor plug domain-containing protein [Phycisphaeraceae bacterium]
MTRSTISGRTFCAMTLTASLIGLSPVAMADEPAAAEGPAAETSAPLPETVVTATRTETPENQLGSSVTVLTRAQMEAEQTTSLDELLRGELGIDIRRSGFRGAQTSIFMRGTNSDHTKVMYDGVNTVDPSVAGAVPPVPFLLTQGLSQVEVVRGPQSALWGSDAIGGVINMVTARGEGP